MKKIPSVTIGIPAYNEQANIKDLLTEVLNQKTINYKLEKILVISDGSKDKTEKIVKSFKNKMIKLLINKKRLGKNETQNRIIKNTTSDILVLLDADTLPRDSNCISNLIAPLKKTSVGLIGGKLYALRTLKKPVGRILANAHEMKRHLFENLPLKNNVYLCGGRLRAFSRDFYKTLRWPDDVPEDAYSFFAVLKRGLKFVYVPDSVIYFHPPTNLSDHTKQNNRFLDGKKALEKYFESGLLSKHYKLSPKNVILTLIKYIFKRPISTPSYISIMLYIKFFSKKSKSHHSKYNVAITSKNLIYEKN